MIYGKIPQTIKQHQRLTLIAEVSYVKLPRKTTEPYPFVKAASPTGTIGMNGQHAVATGKQLTLAHAAHK